MKRHADAVDHKHALLAAALAVISGVGWLNSEIGALHQGHADTTTEATQLRADVRELRAELHDCRRH